MKFKKVLTIMGTTLLGVSLLTGCGSKASATGSGSGNTTTTTDSGVKEIRVSWWGGDNRNAAIQEAIAKFEEKNPNIKVKAEFGGYTGYQEKMTTQLSGGTAPDVIRLDSMWMGQYKKQLVDLNEYSAALGMENFDPTVLEPLTEDGKVLGLPLSTNYRALYYNKTVLDQFGLKPPTSWADLYAMREVLPEDYYPMENPQRPDSAAPFFFFTLMIQQTGKPIADEAGNLNYTEEDCLNMLKFYRQLVDDRIMPSKKNIDEMGIVTGAPAPALTEGKWLTFWEWVANTNTINGQLKDQGFEMGVAGFPTMDGEKSTGVWTKPSMVWSIPDSSKNKEEAAMLINFLMNDPEAIKIQKLENGVPDSKIGKETLEAEGVITAPVAETYVLGAAKLDTGLSGVFKWDRPALSDVILNTITELDYGKITVEEAAHKFYEGFSAEAANMKKQ